MSALVRREAMDGPLPPLAPAERARVDAVLAFETEAAAQEERLRQALQALPLLMETPRGVPATVARLLSGTPVPAMAWEVRLLRLAAGPFEAGLLVAVAWRERIDPGDPRRGWSGYAHVHRFLPGQPVIIAAGHRLTPQGQVPLDQALVRLRLAKVMVDTFGKSRA